MRKLLLVLAALSALVVAAPALAARVTGGSTTVTPSDAAAKVLADNGITVAAVAPATATDGSYTFPIARGRINAKNHGVILHRGGLKLTKGDKSLTLRRLVVVVTKKGGFVAAQTRRHCRVRVGHGHVRVGHGRRHHVRAICRLGFRRVARLSDVTVTGNSATATLKLTKYAARKINKLAGADVAKAGDTLGTAKTTTEVKAKS